MSEIVTCSVAADGERVHRYVAGTLELDAVAEFETHLLGCAECQAAVREGVAVAAALRRISAPVVDTVRVSRRRRWWAVPLAAAAAGVLWLVVGREGPLARLGRVSEAPAFAGVPVRGDADSLSRLADSGMTVYGAGRYREAARLLGAVAAEDRTPALSFYLGVATLLSGNPAGAVAQFRQVPDGSPYVAEAHFYSAKAWLQASRGDSALVHLAAVPADARIAAHAAALADSVRRVLR
jgi:hypothetical protein